MHRRPLGLAGFTFALGVFAPPSVFGQTPPTCAQLNTDPTYGLAGNPVVIQHSTTLVPGAGSNPAYCRVDFTVSERGGPEFGYAVGEIQRIGLRVGLPANTSDGGTGGGVAGQGAWNGKLRNLGGGGLVGAVGGVRAATNARYGLLSEPRACKASAQLNICGQPGAASAPACLTPIEAEVVDLALDGSRNDLGKRAWFPSGRATDLSLALPSNGQGGNGIFAWAAKDLNFDWRTGPRSDWDDLVQLATNTFADYIDMATPDSH